MFDCTYCVYCLQMWNSIFWPCMTATRCVDKSVDDVSFLAGVITGMQQLLPGLPLKPQVSSSRCCSCVCTCLPSSAQYVRNYACGQLLPVGVCMSSMEDYHTNHLP